MPRPTSARLLLPLLLCLGCSAQEQPWPWRCEEGVSCGSDHCVPDGPLTFCLPQDVLDDAPEGPLQTEGPRDTRVRAALPLEPRLLAPEVRVQGTLPANGRWTALYFALDAVAGQQYRLTADCPAAELCVIHFLDAEGHVLVRPSGLQQALRSAALQVPAAGRYYAVLSVDTRLDPQRYGALLNRLEQDDHGETLQTATALSGVDLTLSGRLEVATDRDLFRLPVQADEQFHLACEVEGSDPYPLVLTEEGLRLSPVANPSIYRAHTAMTLLAMEHLRAAPYQCSFRNLEHDDCADSPAQATPLSVPVQRQGWFERDGDVDAFALELQVDRTYLVECQSTAQCTLRVLLPEGREASGLKSLGFQAQQAGRAVLLVKGNNGSTVTDYALRLQ